MKRNRNIGSILLIAAGLLLIAAALYELIPALLAYKRADDTYEALREAYVTGQPGTSSDDPAEEGEELPAWYEALQVDFETLKEANPDVIGWIYFDNIEQIDYPILYSGDDETYLHTDLYGNASKSGCIFMEGNNVPDFNDCHTILYGHNMKNGTMFGPLMDFQANDYLKEHSIVTFDTMYRPGTYKIFASFQSKAYDPDSEEFKYYDFINAETAYDFEEYLNNIKNLSLYYDEENAPSFGDEIITLSTCDYYTTDGRFAVLAKRIK